MDTAKPHFIVLSTLACCLAWAGCGSGAGTPDAAVPPDLSVADLAGTQPDMTRVDLAWNEDGGLVSGSNTVEVVIDGYTGLFNYPFVSVTLCAPGTSTCQTIDHVLLDTGSVGLRITSDALNAQMLAALPTTQIGGQPVGECYALATGYLFGSVRTADVTIGGESSPAMPLQIAGDITTAPDNCQSMGAPLDTASELLANGILGLYPGFNPDCGNPCNGIDDGTGDPGGVYYYACPSGVCTALNVPVAMQLPLPVATFAVDNNGYSLEMQPISDATGAASAVGLLTFGIGTQPNNMLENAKILSAAHGQLNGTAYGVVFDSGTQYIDFIAPGVQPCPTSGEFDGLLCPTTTQTMNMTFTATDQTAVDLSFKIADASKLFDDNPSAAVFDDIGGNIDASAGEMILGMPIFFGRRIFVGITGKTTGTQAGPFYAF